MKKALICGVSGQDGSYLAQFLLEKGYNVYGASRDAQTSPFINLKKLGIKDEIKLLSINITDFGNTLECINKIKPDELGGGTFTITNTGSRGALFDTPIINQPQVAILGLGAVVKRPMVVKGADGGETIAIRSMVYLALSYDHRVVDGADAARFLVTLKERLEEGRFESDLGL